jgi:hypothetical protein
MFNNVNIEDKISKNIVINFIDARLKVEDHNFMYVCVNKIMNIFSKYICKCDLRY